MKKVVSLFAILILIFSAFSYNAFAEVSPEGDKKVKVEITNNIDEDDKTISYEVKGDNIEISVNEEYIKDGYKFVKWVINGEYEIVSGSLTSKDLVIRPLGDVKLTQLFDIEGIEDEKEEEKEEGESNKSDVSPQTSDSGLISLLAGAALVSAIALSATKKNR